jgi:hypothetical protein
MPEKPVCGPMDRRSFLTAAALSAVLPLRGLAQTRQTEVTIRGDAFYINGRPTYPGRTFNEKRVEGLLMNSRMVQGIFDDLNPETASRWVYPDTKRWDPDRNTTEFIAAMPEWKRHGVLAFTINLQAEVLEAGDEGAVPAQARRHPALPRLPARPLRSPRPKRVRRVLNRLERRHRRVGARAHVADGVGREHPDTPLTTGVVRQSDYMLIHGNGPNDTALLKRCIAASRSLNGDRGVPVMVNEDPNFSFTEPTNHLLASVDEYVSWGYYEQGQGNYQDGFQSPPVNWGISSENKRQFFELVKKVTGV